jgi:sensory rhodopsin
VLNFSLWTGLVLFGLSSLYFYFAGRKRPGLNAAFLVSLITLISYVLMVQGNLILVTEDGEPIYPSRWLFYAASCTLLIVEIARLKRIEGQERTYLIYLTAIVMGTGFLAARDLTAVRWAFFAIGALAYLLLIVKVLSIRARDSRWVRRYIWFGWTLFPVVFLLGPTGWGWLGAGWTALFYLLLDLYTKVVFNIRLARASR